MRESAKGQSGVLVASIALMMAVPLTQIPNAAVESILSDSFADMEKNSMRYRSMAHSYKFISEDFNNRKNFSEFESSLTSIPSNNRCESSSFQRDSYNVSFDDVTSGTNFNSKGCSTGIVYVTNAFELRYPALPFYEIENSDRVSISTVVTID